MSSAVPDGAEADPVQTVLADGILTITLARPAALNALDRSAIAGLEQAVAAAGAVDGLIGVLLRGAGGKAFSAGADLRVLAACTPAEGRAIGERVQQVTLALEALPVPVVAVVDGYALGGGCELALGCDLVYATIRARFAQPEVAVGLIPGFGGTARLPRRIGTSRALDLVLSGRQVDAEEALRIGLVDRLLPDEPTALAEAGAFLRLVASRAPTAVAAAKRLVHQAGDRGLGEALVAEAEAYESAFATADAAEGMRAFLQRRPPGFGGRTGRG